PHRTILPHQTSFLHQTTFHHKKTFPHQTISIQQTSFLPFFISQPSFVIHSHPPSDIHPLSGRPPFLISRLSTPASKGINLNVRTTHRPEHQYRPTMVLLMKMPSVAYGQRLVTSPPIYAQAGWPRAAREQVTSSNKRPLTRFLATAPSICQPGNIYPRQRSQEFGRSAGSPRAANQPRLFNNNITAEHRRSNAEGGRAEMGCLTHRQLHVSSMKFIRKPSGYWE
ncbi:hypothetical protein LSH36_310g01022, partial [Paralvinella palmiformis]